MPSQLDHLRSLTSVDCDTLDLSVASSLGPFVDCTSNQAIAFAELQSPAHAHLISKCASLTLTLQLQHPTVPPTELFAELLQVHLSAQMLPHLTGRTHVQTNPLHSFSTTATISNARRIISHFSHLSIPRDRICIKIPSTWEGLQAIRVLEQEGIACLATTLFTMTQAAAAGAVNATYIAPYVHDLRVHFFPDFVERGNGLDVCVQAHLWYQAMGLRTEVLPASLITVEEVLRLRGLPHLTVAPALLRAMKAGEWVEGVVAADLEGAALQAVEGLRGIEDDEAGWRLKFNREADGEGVERLCQAVNIFCGFQEKIEAMARDALEKAARK